MRALKFLFCSSILTSILLILFLDNPLAQVTEEWVARYNDPENYTDEARSLAVDDSGNVYVTGRSGGTGIGLDYATIKYNSSGVQQWVQRYNGPGNGVDLANSIAVDGLGNVYVTGESKGIETFSDYATIKYNSSGVQQWVARYNGPANELDEARSIAVDPIGNVYVTGYSYESGKHSDYATIKYNSSGVQQWVQRYNGAENDLDEAYSVAVDASGNVYVTGYSHVIGWYSDYVTIKYNSSGVQQWVQRYYGPVNDDDEAYSLTIDASSNVYVTGMSWGSVTGIDYATIKYNSSGVQQWVARFAGPGHNNDIAYSLAVDASGNVYVTGLSIGGQTVADYATIKYNSSGTQQWVAIYNGPGNDVDVARSLAVDASGNVYVTGVSRNGTLNGTEDYATIKYNSSGVQQWVQRYNGPGNNIDDAYSLAVDASGNVYITGTSRGIGTHTDYATIKYAQTIGIHPISNEVPERYQLYQNYPNPFNPATKIRFDIPPYEGGQGDGSPLNGYVTLKFYDILGREVVTLVNEQLQPGTYEVEWDGTAYPSAVYFYKIVAADFTETRKMILLK